MTNPLVNIKTVMAGRPDRRAAHQVLDATYGKGGWQYVGWANRAYGLLTSPLANPYTCLAQHRAERVQVATVEEAIAGCRVQLWERVQAGDTAVLAALRAIGPETVIVCWCDPDPCHGTVVARAAAWLRDEEEQGPLCGAATCSGDCPT